jgi:hypothetical protein
MTSNPIADRRSRRLGAFTAAAVAAVAGLTALGAGAAKAEDCYETPMEYIEDVTDDGVLNCSHDDDVLVFPDVPLVPLPGDDDGPTITIDPAVVIPLPGGDDGPTITIDPDVVIPLPEAEPSDPSEPAEPAEPADSPDQNDDATPTTLAPAPPTTTQPPLTPVEVSEPVVPSEPYLQILAAAVECDGSVNVVYQTGADPALAGTAEHIVSFSPVAVPTLAFSQRLVGQPLNGDFAVDVPTPGVDRYLVFVVADLEPTSADGVLLVDEALAMPPTDCPA